VPSVLNWRGSLQTRPKIGVWCPPQIMVKVSQPEPWCPVEDGINPVTHFWEEWNLFQ